MDESRVTTSVTIYGVEYRLRGPDEQFARDVAKMVDRRMREVALHQQTASQMRIAVMTLLNLAGELRAERQRRERAEAELRERLRGLGDRIADSLMDRSSASAP